jgi:hypothetical protein
VANRTHPPTEQCEHCTTYGECRNGHTFYSHGKPDTLMCAECRRINGIRVSTETHWLATRRVTPSWEGLAEDTDDYEGDDGPDDIAEPPECDECGAPMILSSHRTSFVCPEGHTMPATVAAIIDATDDDDADDADLWNDAEPAPDPLDVMRNEVFFEGRRHMLALNISEVVAQFDTSHLLSFNNGAAREFQMMFKILARRAASAVDDAELENIDTLLQEGWNMAGQCLNEITVASSRQQLLAQYQAAAEVAAPVEQLAIEAPYVEPAPQYVQPTTPLDGVLNSPLVQNFVSNRLEKLDAKAARGTCEVSAHDWSFGGATARHIVTGYSDDGKQYRSVRTCGTTGHDAKAAKMLARDGWTSLRTDELS